MLQGNSAASSLKILLENLFSVNCYDISNMNVFTLSRALTPLFGNGTGAHGLGKISVILTKIGKFDIVLMYDVSIRD